MFGLQEKRSIRFFRTGREGKAGDTIELTNRSRQFLINYKNLIDYVAVSGWVLFTEGYTSASKLHDKIDGTNLTKGAVSQWREWAHPHFCLPESGGLRGIAGPLARQIEPAGEAQRNWPDRRRDREGQQARLMPSLAQKVASEFLGTAFLLAAVIGSGTMAQRLAGVMLR